VTTPSTSGFPKNIGAPATGAFLAAGYTGIDDLVGVPARELAKLHGVGPKALERIQEALQATGRSLG
jgi:DNA-directed RNA polymerase alpha subunit